MAGRIWTAEEEEYLRRAWGSVSVPAIAHRLGRTTEAVACRANKLRLGRYIGHGTADLSICGLFRAIYPPPEPGRRSPYCNYVHWRDRWLAEGLPVRRRRLTRKGSHLLVDLDDFWHWAEQHQELMNFKYFPEGNLGPEPRWVPEKRKRDRGGREKHKARWTAEEDSLLLALVRLQKWTYIELEQKMERSQQAIRARLERLGVPDRPLETERRHWTEEETRTVLQMKARGETPEKIAKAVGRTDNAVKSKIFKETHRAREEGEQWQ